MQIDRETLEDVVAALAAATRGHGLSTGSFIPGMKTKMAHYPCRCLQCAALARLRKAMEAKDG